MGLFKLSPNCKHKDPTDTRARESETAARHASHTVMLQPGKLEIWIHPRMPALTVLDSDRVLYEPWRPPNLDVQASYASVGT
eukprot:SAG31_NODE_9831_length_1222_cov_1.345503_2_plen_82_part_00